MIRTKLISAMLYWRGHRALVYDYVCLFDDNGLIEKDMLLYLCFQNEAEIHSRLLVIAVVSIQHEHPIDKILFANSRLKLVSIVSI